MGSNNRMGIETRDVAFRVILVFIWGTLLGSLLPESGNVVAYYIGGAYGKEHIFNPCFLAVGVAGVVLACRFRYRNSG